MLEDKPVVSKRHVSMYPQDWQTVQEVSDRYRLHNLSAALRFIVNEYGRVNEPTPQPPTPQED